MQLTSSRATLDFKPLNWLSTMFPYIYIHDIENVSFDDNQHVPDEVKSRRLFWNSSHHPLTLFPNRPHDECVAILCSKRPETKCVKASSHQKDVRQQQRKTKRGALEPPSPQRQEVSDVDHHVSSFLCLKATRCRNWPFVQFGALPYSFWVQHHCHKYRSQVCYTLSELK